MDTPHDLGIDPYLIERFRADLAKVWPEGKNSERRLTIAVSGGPDSLALLLLAHSCLPERVGAVTVDHQIRDESAHEAASVAEICRELGVEHQTLTVNLGPGNLQQEARKARYSAMQEWLESRSSTGDTLATAHHGDDQVETLVMRLNRASGLSGLAGTRYKRWLLPGPNTGIALVRPLLEWRREDLEGIVSQAGMTPIQDPSNRDEAFDRVRIRNALADADWIDHQAWSRSAQFLADAAETFEILGAREFQSEVKRIEQGFEYTPVGIRLVAIEVLLKLFGELGAEISRAEASNLFYRLSNNDNASLAGILATARDEFDPVNGYSFPVWKFEPEPPRRSG